MIRKNGGAVQNSKGFNRRRFNHWLAASSIAGASGAVFETSRRQQTRGGYRRWNCRKLNCLPFIKVGCAVTLIEKTVASGASHSTFAWINATWASSRGTATRFPNKVGSWHRLQEELDLPIVWGGSLEWFASDSRQARFVSDIAEQQAWGEPARMLTGAEAQAIEPVEFHGATQVASSPRDGAIDPVLVSRPWWLLRFSRELKYWSVARCWLLTTQRSKRETTPD